MGRMIKRARLAYLKKDKSRLDKKKKPYKKPKGFSYAIWHCLIRMATWLNIVLLTTEKQWRAQSACPSMKILKFYWKDDAAKTAHSAMASYIVSGHSRGFNAKDVAIRNAEKSESAKNRMPKGISTCNNAEREVIDKLTAFMTSSFTDLFPPTAPLPAFTHLQGSRLMDVGFSRNTGNSEVSLFKGLQYKTTATSSVDWNTNTTYGEMVTYICNQRGAIIFAACLPGRKPIVWFVFDDKEETVSKTLSQDDRKKKRFVPYPVGTGRVCSVHTRYMTRFRYDFAKDDDIARFVIAFRHWEALAIERPLEFWDHDNSQIPCKSHRMENASGLSLRDSVFRRNVATRFVSNDQVDAVFTTRSGIQIRAQCKNLQSRNRVQIHRPGSLVYDRNKIDVLLVPMTNGEEDVDKELPSTWTRVRVVAMREPTLNLERATLCFNVFKKYRDFDLRSETQAFVNYMIICKAKSRVRKKRDEPASVSGAKRKRSK